MARVALDGNSINTSTASNHIYYECWEVVGQSCNEDGCTPIYGWVGYYTSATVHGTCKATVNNVYINGKNAILNGDKTVENDSYSVPCTYRSGAHNNAQGTVTSGNTKNVYINGKLVSVVGSSVQTHANTNTSIGASGSSANVSIG